MKQKFKLISLVMLAGIAMATTSITQKSKDDNTESNKRSHVIASKPSMKERLNFIDSCLHIISAHPGYIGSPPEYMNKMGMQNAFVGSFRKNVFIGFPSTNKAIIFSGGFGDIHILPHSKTPL